MDIVLGVIVGLVVLMFLVTAHEFGHFLMARKNGVRVLEFGIGFPPRAVAWVKDPKTKKWRRLKRSEWKKERVTKAVVSGGDEAATKAEGVKAEGATEKAVAEKIAPGLIFSLNWLPIGGFCQMDGESASDTRPGTFGSASFLSKTKILFGGVAMNWLVAWVILTILAWTGMPQFLPGQFTVATDTRVEARPVEIVKVAADSPAEAAGLLPGDRILAVDGNEFSYASEIISYNDEHAGEEVLYRVERTLATCGEGLDWTEDEDCEDATIAWEKAVTLNDAEASFRLGAELKSTQTLAYSTWSAPLTGAGLTLQMTGMTFQGVGELIGNLFSGVGQMLSFNDEVREAGQEALETVGDSVSGPVGIIGQLFPSYVAAGPTNLFFLTAIISISLACMNVLPIPALDGGRWLLIAIFKLLKKPLRKETEEKIVSRAMMVLLLLIFVVTILDIMRFTR